MCSCQAPTATITSDPPGAECFLDGRSLQRTPADMKCLHPGQRRIEVMKDQYTTADRVLETRPSPPVWIFPLDFPWDLVKSLFSRRHMEVHFKLEPAARKTEKGPSAQEVLDLTRRAAELGGRRPD